MTIDRRRLSAQKAFDRIRQAGLPMEDDPRFLAWIEQWIAGEINMPEVRKRYVGMLHERASQRGGIEPAHIAASVPEQQTIEGANSLLDEITKG